MHPVPVAGLPSLSTATDHVAVSLLTGDIENDAEISENGVLNVWLTAPCWLPFFLSHHCRRRRHRSRRL
jgi:hypothetical protein